MDENVDDGSVVTVPLTRDLSWRILVCFLSLTSHHNAGAREVVSVHRRQGPGIDRQWVVQSVCGRMTTMEVEQ